MVEKPSSPTADCAASAWLGFTTPQAASPPTDGQGCPATSPTQRQLSVPQCCVSAPILALRPTMTTSVVPTARSVGNGSVPPFTATALETMAGQGAMVIHDAGALDGSATTRS